MSKFEGDETKNKEIINIQTAGGGFFWTTLYIRQKKRFENLTGGKRYGLTDGKAIKAIFICGVITLVR